MSTQFGRLIPVGCQRFAGWCCQGRVFPQLACRKYRIAEHLLRGVGKSMTSFATNSKGFPGFAYGANAKGECNERYP